MGELLLKERHEIPSSVILRLPLVVGEGMRSGWLFGVYEALRRHEPVHIYGGDSPYNMIGVSDVGDAISGVLRRAPIGGEVFTLGCQDWMSVREIVDFMKQYLQSESEIAEDGEGRRGFVVSSEKARRELGFQPRRAKDILLGFLEETTGNRDRG
jgi:nucleoside-diphosphate-sugar epimerase